MLRVVTRLMHGLIRMNLLKVCNIIFFKDMKGLSTWMLLVVTLLSVCTKLILIALDEWRIPFLLRLFLVFLSNSLQIVLLR